MKRYYFFVFIAIVAVSLSSCGKKQSDMQELQEPLSIETLSTVGNDTKAAAASVVPAGTSLVENESFLAPLPPAGPYKPTVLEIQAALKHAGFYFGTVDGKLGPKSKAAIIEFQKANGLTADGKVGPKTWAALAPHLAEAQASAGVAEGQ